ncbi:MAG: DUF2059 domain-containing protein [Blastocatellia bacterium]
MNEFLDPIAAVYARHFSEDELKRLAAFYEIPPGKKMVSSQEPVGEDEGPARTGFFPTRDFSTPPAGLRRLIPGHA